MSALTGIQKILIAVVALTLLGGAYFFYSSQAGTSIGLVSVEPGFVCGTSSVSDADGNVYNTVAIGQQCWMKQNMRVGTFVSTTTGQTDNAVIEKFCYDNTESYCTGNNNPNYPDGGLYLWNEAMQYSTTPGAQGICPSGWHIPTHDEWTTLERAVATSSTYLTDFPYDTSTQGYRGTYEGVVLRSSGTSGFEANFTGSSAGGISFGSRGESTTLWSSTLSNNIPWSRTLWLYSEQVNRSKSLTQTNGYPVRCLKDSPTTGMGGTLTTNPALENGLVGHWTFDGKDVDWSSTTAEIRDRSGNGNHGNATTSMSASSSVVAGVLGQALSFNGSNTYVDLGASSLFDMGSGDYTTSAWVKYSTSTDWDAVVGKGKTGAGNKRYATFLDKTTNKIECDNDDNVTDTNYLSAQAYNDNEWHHVVCARDDSTLYMYIDGVAEPSYDATGLGSLDDAAPALIGALYSVSPSTRHFTSGSVDDVRIYNRALSADEVKRLYQLGATTKVAQTLNENPNLESGLILHWTFDGEYTDWSSTTAEVRDRSITQFKGNANNIGADDVTPGIFGQSLHFATNTEYVQNTSMLRTQAPLTSSLWVRPDVEGQDGNVIVVQRSSGSPFRSWRHHWTRSTGWKWTVYDSGGVASTIDSNSTIKLGEWNHMVGVLKSNYDMELWINGVLQTELLNSGSIFTADSAFRVGAEDTTAVNGYTLNGAIDDVRVYDRALSAGEIQRLYDLGR